MTEAFLHHLWKFKLFDSARLLTTDGEAVEVLKPGLHNTDAGPDFFNAQLKIGETTWAGNVEIHLKSSDWNKHKHTSDAAYNNVVLHVVHEHDEEVYTRGETRIATLELKDRFNPAIFQNYVGLVESLRWIPCEDHIGKVEPIIMDNWLDRLLTERLEKNTQLVFHSLQVNRNNWEETFYHHLAKNFGFKTNALPFEMLAKSLPLSILAKHQDHLNQLEALLFGQAGLLDRDFHESYPQQLKKEYEFLRSKFSLKPMDGSQWKFLRLRPSNFPTLRIAQFARLLHNGQRLFHQCIAAEEIKPLENLFAVHVSDYWRSHYVFDKPSREHDKTLGADAARIILVNTVIPLIFAYGTFRNEEACQMKALRFLEELPAEKNSIISGWNCLGITSSNAGRTQALLQLKNEYCSQKKCLLCSVGNKIISADT